MQIHSQNFNKLAQYGLTENQLRLDPCLNIYTGAFYLREVYSHTRGYLERRRGL